MYKKVVLYGQTKTFVYPCSDILELSAEEDNMSSLTHAVVDRIYGYV